MLHDIKFFLVPHLSITRYSLANRNSDLVIKQKAMLQQHDPVKNGHDYAPNISSIRLDDNAHVPQQFNENSFKNQLA